jgi:pSer/pThr/pTyr-binding forkhead associated (FHA) protein
MPYLILADRKGEFDRRDLASGPVIIGRALDCDVCVKDILLSRRHCRVEPFDDRYVVTDLGSKNGTRVGSEMVTRHILSDGDVFRIGKIQVSFHAGEFVPAPKGSTRPRDVRPADPNEALSGTVLGFQLFDMEEDSRVSGFPIPKPRPSEPPSYRQEAGESIVAQITSTSWDLALTESELTEKAAAAAAAGKPPQEIVERQKEIELERLAKNDPGSAAALLKAAEKQKRKAERAIAQRSTDPTQRFPGVRWLAYVYIVLGLLLGTGAVLAILAQSGLMFNWLAQ